MLNNDTSKQPSYQHWLASLLLAVVAVAGCNTKNGGSGSSGDIPSFSLAWSEYPSWSVFGVAHANKLIDKDAGKMGPIEEKWGVDIVLKQLDYDSCIKQYGNGDVDAVCITNMDILSPSLGRSSVAVLPTSTSNGADACIVIGINDLDELKSHKVYGLGRSVSEYCFVRNLQLNNKNEAEYQFTDKAPEDAAVAMQTDPDTTKAIVVWNPFVLETLRKVNGSKRLFDSSTIAGEIVDMVAVAEQSLEQPGGDKFACAVIDTYYQVSKMIDDSLTRDETLLALAAKFAPDLTLEDMNVIVKETDFYETPELGTELFTGDKLPEIMQQVVGFCSSHGMVDKEPTIVYGSGDANLRFDASYIKKVQDAQ
ncbi:MAG: hypothetical protein R3E01_21415 [Pirellulaceae bacterium]|nr:hypothetical protein [Planctomycetales bacterium]